MNFFAYFIITVLFLGVVFLLYQLYVFKKTKVPYMATPKKRYDFIFKNIQIDSETIVYDLGCGKGDFLFEAEKYGAKKLVGYELSPLHALWGQFMAKLKKSKVKIFKKDYFEADISQADLIYLFLTPRAVARLSDKILNETKSKALVVSLGAPIEKLPNPRIIETNPGSKHPVRLYLYTMP